MLNLNKSALINNLIQLFLLKSKLQLIEDPFSHWSFHIFLVRVNRVCPLCARAVDIMPWWSKQKNKQSARTLDYFNLSSFLRNLTNCHIQKLSSEKEHGEAAAGPVELTCKEELHSQICERLPAKRTESSRALKKNRSSRAAAQTEVSSEAAARADRSELGELLLLQLLEMDTLTCRIDRENQQARQQQLKTQKWRTERKNSSTNLMTPDTLLQQNTYKNWVPQEGQKANKAKFD